MSRINLHLYSTDTITPERLGRDFKVTKKQQIAFNCIVLNVKKAKGKPVHFSMRNEANLPEMHNPFDIGNTVLYAVLKKLRKAGLVTIKKGTAWYTGEKRKLSSFTATQDFADFAGALNDDPQEKHRARVIYKDTNGKVVEHTPTAYTDRIEQIMSAWGNYLDEQTIKVDAEEITDFYITRSYNRRSVYQSVTFQCFGGRAWHMYMSMSKAKRKRIRINGEETVGIDYSASVPNCVYEALTGKRIYPDDPYAVEGVPRSIAKKVINICLNTHIFKLYGAFNFWLKEEATAKEKQDFQTAKQNLKTKKNIFNACMERNKPIGRAFLQGVYWGQYWAWLEANLVFEVAHYASMMDIPCLTIHDEFIVRKSDAEAMQELLYTVGLPDCYEKEGKDYLSTLYQYEPVTL